MPEVAPKNQTEETFEPESLHRITYGNPPRNSLPAQLIGEHEISDLMAPSGKFEGIKRTIEVTNAEMYQYLRLGVSTQSASCLKFLGYETPESLTESPRVAPLLPDHLARNGHYPTRFIDLCEQEGVSAVVCQMAIRRGLTDDHLDGTLSLRELLYAFTNFVKKNVIPGKAATEGQETLISYVCDGTLPYEFLKGEDAPTQHLLAIARGILVADPDSEIAKRLKNDKMIFKKFANHLGCGSVERVRKAVDKYGYESLDLSNPLLCFMDINEGKEGGRRELGLESAKYVDAFSDSGPKRSWQTANEYLGYQRDLTFHSNGSWAEPVRITFDEFDELHRSGIAPHIAYQYIVNDKIPVGSIISAQEDGLEVSLMGGAL